MTEPREDRAEAELDETRRLGKLARRMIQSTPTFWPGHGEAGQGDNENIPAGYTYFAQFVAHDLVSNLAPLPDPAEAGFSPRRDFRGNRLALDALYGGGPATDMHLFSLRGSPRQQRMHLRLGHVAIREGLRNTLVTATADQLLPEQPARDIPRAACPFQNDRNDRRRLGFTDLLIADPRNDDNLILSQLTAAFHALHNIVVDRLVALRGDASLTDADAYRTFLLARRVVALAYRRIIVKDLLCRLLDETIYTRFTSGKAAPSFSLFPELGDSKRPFTGVPPEFSHAAFRFAHAIVRHSYPLNADLQARQGNATLDMLLHRSSSRGASLLPLSCDWLVEWGNFFAIDAGRKPAASRRIRPDVGGGPLSLISNFPNEHGVGDGGLFFRDLARGVDAGVASVEDLVRKLPNEDAARSTLLICPRFRRKKIADWLAYSPHRHAAGAFSGAHPDDASDLEHLAEHPPLYFFILFEAAHDKGGQRLGILGSTIVAEVMFAALASGEAQIEEHPVVASFAGQVFAGGVPETMPELLKFVQAHGGLDPVACPET